jgi:hypothetical protein
MHVLFALAPALVVLVVGAVVVAAVADVVGVRSVSVVQKMSMR